MKYKKKKTILMLGVGGVSMHQLALAYAQLGYKVIGYDAKENEYTKLLRSKKIIVVHKFKKLKDISFCVFSPAIKDDNPFVQYCKTSNIPLIDRAVALNKFFKYFKHVIAVAGTHGKSTTCALIYEMLRADKRSVSCHIGANLPNARFKLGDDFLVVEACEYNKSFLKLYPNITVVTNVEKEHMDSYKNMFDLRNSFLNFLKRGQSRFVFFEKSTTYLSKINCNLVTNNNLRYKAKLKGDYNKNNICLAIEVAKNLKISNRSIKKVVENFSGIDRRYQEIGAFNDAKIYIDYAHHPTEVKAFLSTFNAEFDNNLIVFQPHTYSRTKLFFKQFVDILSAQKNVVLFKEYPARECASCGLSAKDLYNEITKKNPNAIYVENFKEIYKFIDNLGFKVNAIAFVGAGDIDEIAKKIVEKNKKTVDK